MEGKNRCLNWQVSFSHPHARKWRLLLQWELPHGPADERTTTLAHTLLFAFHSSVLDIGVSIVFFLQVFFFLHTQSLTWGCIFWRVSVMIARDAVWRCHFLECFLVFTSIRMFER